MTAEEIRTKIEHGLPGSRVQVRDTTGTGDHFEATVVAEQFAGKNMVEQHRMVYSILGTANIISYSYFVTFSRFPPLLYRGE